MQRGCWLTVNNGLLCLRPTPGTCHLLLAAAGNTAPRAHAYLAADRCADQLGLICAANNLAYVRLQTLHIPRAWSNQTKLAQGLSDKHNTIHMTKG